MLERQLGIAPGGIRNQSFAMDEFRLEVGLCPFGEKFARRHVEQISASDLDDAICKAMAAKVSVWMIPAPSLVLIFDDCSRLVWVQICYQLSKFQKPTKRPISRRVETSFYVNYGI
jgi:hypothetical protein